MSGEWRRQLARHFPRTADHVHDAQWGPLQTSTFCLGPIALESSSVRVAAAWAIKEKRGAPSTTWLFTDLEQSCRRSRAGPSQRAALARCCRHRTNRCSGPTEAMIPRCCPACRAKGGRRSTPPTYAWMRRSRAVLAPSVMVSTAVVVSRHAASTSTRNSGKQGGHPAPVVHVDDARRRGCPTGETQVFARGTVAPCLRWAGVLLAQLPSRERLRLTRPRQLRRLVAG